MEEFSPGCHCITALQCIGAARSSPKSFDSSNCKPGLSVILNEEETLNCLAQVTSIIIRTAWKNDPFFFLH